MSTQFDRIFHGTSTVPGRFRIAAPGMAWRPESGEKDKEQNLVADILRWAQWMRVARGYQLRIGLKDRSRETFDGFEREDQDRITSLLKQHFGIVLEVQEISIKGWNWGVTDFRGEELAFLVSNKLAFELPLTDVANSNIAGRTEVSLEYQPPQRKGKNAPDEMVEIRFFVPGTASKNKGSDAGSDADIENDDEEEISAAQAFHDAIKEKAELGQVTGDMILRFEEVLIVTPRGRYDVDMFPEFLRLRGKTYDYKIAYPSIQTLFLLPKDEMHILFVLGLSTPIRQGQTRYQYLVMQFNREEETTAELNMSDEDIAKHERLKKNYEDPTFEVVSSIFRALSGRKIISGGSYISRNQTPGLKANLKAVQGDLFLLDKYIFFVSKQPVLVELADVHQVVFSRVGSSSSATAGRTFDVRVVSRSGPEHTFSSINKEEQDAIMAYFKEKKVRLKNETAPEEAIAAAIDDSDEEMQSVASDDGEKPRVRLAGDEDEDSEEDEDFQASSSDGGSPTSSSGSDDDDDAEGGKSDAGGDSPKAKGKAKAPPTKKTAPKKSKGSEESDADDSDDDKPAKKAAPKPKPKPKPKAKKDDDAMDVDDDAPAKPKPKPKPKVAKKDGEEGPAKKKLKTA
ncbi:unnamed protein product [Peniophora sp. CBMAI 1063]|nr:unnamed protein product [Peniophora sp. CBMAI 1063]